MLEKSFGIFFFLKKPKIENQDGTRYVYLKITVDGDSEEISTKRLWHPSRWSKESGIAAGKKEDSSFPAVCLDACIRCCPRCTAVLNRSKVKGLRM